MTPKLEIQGLSKWFGDLEVLRDIEFQIQEHEFLAIVGPSGCGKTTLLRMIAGIENADAGPSRSMAVSRGAGCRSRFRVPAGLPVSVEDGLAQRGVRA